MTTDSGSERVVQPLKFRGPWGVRYTTEQINSGTAPIWELDELAAEPAWEYLEIGGGSFPLRAPKARELDYIAERMSYAARVVNEEVNGSPIHVERDMYWHLLSRVRRHLGKRRVFEAVEDVVPFGLDPLHPLLYNGFEETNRYAAFRESVEGGRRAEPRQKRRWGQLALEHARSFASF